MGNLAILCRQSALPLVHDANVTVGRAALVSDVEHPIRDLFHRHEAKSINEPRRRGGLVTTSGLSGSVRTAAQSSPKFPQLGRVLVVNLARHLLGNLATAETKGQSGCESDGAEGEGEGNL